MSEDDDATPIQKLSDAVREFTNATNPAGAAVVVGFVVVLEWLRFDDDGDELHAIDYACHGGGMATTLGLLDAGLVMVRRDVIADDQDDE